MAATDLVTIGEATAFLQQPQSSALIGLWISSVSDRIDDLCGPIVARTLTELHHGGIDSIVLKHPPVLSVASVTEYAGTTANVLVASTLSTQPALGYELRPSGIIYRRSGVGRLFFAYGSSNIQVVYSAGRYADTASVSARFKQACLIAVSHLWQAEHGTRTATFGGLDDQGSATYGPGWAIPRRALDLLGNEIRANTGIA